ncbi:MAG: 50S ribosomal protein L23 [Candidatus Dojkabacteria bacterium]|nr:MAG: 50S ribosomal protein L23 [Candidatus Dojkabacteria bacterium]
MKRNAIIQPVISEKSYDMANAQNKYVFYVDPAASKVEIAKAIEGEYKVKVVSVNTTVRPGKIRRDWRYSKSTRISDRKKAVVKLKDGDKIDDFFNF